MITKPFLLYNQGVIPRVRKIARGDLLIFHDYFSIMVLMRIDLEIQETQIFDKSFSPQFFSF